MSFSNRTVCLIVLFASFFAFANASWLIYPGTQYCGAGKNTDRKLTLHKENSCCKAHDQCPIGLKSGASGYGTKNNKLLTVMSCECDSALRSCLNKVNSKDAKKIRELFDATAGKYCLKKDNTCIKYSGSKCVKHRTRTIVKV